MAGEVHAFTTSSGETRCFTLYRPSSAPSPAAVMIYFHDRGDTAVECGREGSEFVRQAFADGFALVCAEARELSSYDGWRIGNYGVVHDENANPCNVHDSLEKPYMDQIFKVLRTKRLGDFHKVGDISLIQSTNPAFSMGQVFAAGYGRGAAFAAFVSFCYPSSISGFVQAGSGLKIKGDGVLLDSGAGECADCRYWPIKVLSATAVGRSFRHCAFSSLADTIAPATMSRAMCSAMRREGHSSTLYMSESGAATNVRPKKFLARAAHCMMIGGADAPPFPTVDPCDPSASYSREEGSPDSMNTGTLSMSVSTIGAGTQVVNADSAILPIAVTSEPCPPWNCPASGRGGRGSASVFPRLRIVTHGCPAHHVDTTVPDQSTMAMYQQYTITIPFISDASVTNSNAASILGPVPLSDAVPTFGGPVGLAVDGAFFYNDLTSTGHDAVLSEKFDLCHGHNDELGRYHYHQIPLCLLEFLGDTTPPRSQWQLLSSATIHANGSNLHEWVSQWPEVSPKGPSPLLGWALDGVPIYGPYDETGLLLAWGGDFPSIQYPNMSSRLDNVPTEASNQVADVVRTIVKVKVTVGAKTLDNPQHPSYHAGGNSDPLCFYLNGVEGTAFVMQRGLTYQFFQSESDFLEYPFRFYGNIESTVESEPYSGVDVTNFASSSTFYNGQHEFEDENEDGILRRLVLEFRVDALSPRITSSAAVDTNHDRTAYFLTFGSSGGLLMGGRVSLRSGNEKIVRVTVAPKTLGNKYHPAIMPHASPLGYYFDGIEADSFQFIRGMSYIFDQTMSASNLGHPLRFYLTNDKITLYANDEDVSVPF
eukprot:g3129.t1